MKTIREGDPRYNEPWYVKLSFECDCCGWVGKPETRFEVGLRDFDDRLEVSVRCETCHARVVSTYEGVTTIKQHGRLSIEDIG